MENSSRQCSCLFKRSHQQVSECERKTSAIAIHSSFPPPKVRGANIPPCKLTYPVEISGRRARAKAAQKQRTPAFHCCRDAPRCMLVGTVSESWRVTDFRRRDIGAQHSWPRDSRGTIASYTKICHVVSRIFFPPERPGRSDKRNPSHWPSPLTLLMEVALEGRMVRPSRLAQNDLAAAPRYGHCRHQAMLRYE